MTISLGEMTLVDQGKGPSTVVLLHGWCCRTGDFAAQVKEFSREHRVVVVDWQDRMRARGSDRSFSGICKDTIELLDELEVRHPLLCGHSMGGYLTLQMVANHGFEARGLLALDTTMPVSDPVKTAFGSWIDELSPENLVHFYHTTGSMQFFKPVEIGDISQAIMTRMMSRPLDEARDLIREVCSPEFVLDFQSLTIPFHYVSSGVNGISTEPVIKKLVPDAGYDHIDESGHFMTIFHPDRVNEIIAGML